MFVIIECGKRFHEVEKNVLHDVFGPGRISLSVSKSDSVDEGVMCAIKSGELGSRIPRTRVELSFVP